MIVVSLSLTLCLPLTAFSPFAMCLCVCVCVCGHACVPVGHCDLPCIDYINIFSFASETTSKPVSLVCAMNARFAGTDLKLVSVSSN